MVETDIEVEFLRAMKSAGSAQATKVILARNRVLSFPPFGGLCSKDTRRRITDVSYCSSHAAP